MSCRLLLPLSERVPPNTLFNYSPSFFPPSSLACLIFPHTMCYLLMHHFLSFHISLFHLCPGTPKRLYVLEWGALLRRCLVCSPFYPQGAGCLPACNGCSGQIWKTGSVFALHKWKHRDVPLANRGQRLDAIERLPGPATPAGTPPGSRSSPREELHLPGVPLSPSQAPFQENHSCLTPQSRPTWRSPWSHRVILELLSPQAWGSFLR